jgi:hypothetical protein
MVAYHGLLVLTHWGRTTELALYPLIYCVSWVVTKLRGLVWLFGCVIG